MLIAALVLISCDKNISRLGNSEGKGSVPSDTASVAPSSSPRPRVFHDLEPGWNSLPSPPEVRVTAATGWTGHQLIVWGGYVYSGFSDEVPQSDGFAFDARSKTWDPIAASPLGPRILPASAWTGTELLIWGGADLDLREFFDDGAAYDPRSDTWRTLPQAPIDARAPLSVWTGRELIVWGTAARIDERPRNGTAYDPFANTWRMIAESPIELTDASAAWTGREMIVFGAALHGGNKPETKTAIAAAYRPATDTWRRLPNSELSPQASTAAWDGQELIAWDYLNESAALNPVTNKWRDLRDIPLENYECSPQSIPVGTYIFGDYCGLMAVFEPSDDKWHDVSRHDFAGWGFTLVAADPVVLLMGRDVDTEDEAMFAYLPPTW